MGWTVNLFSFYKKRSPSAHIWKTPATTTTLTKTHQNKHDNKDMII